MGHGDENLKMLYPDFPLETYLHHLNRYRFADNVLPKNIQVYDFGCGTGYGSNVLRKNNRFVIGFDRDEESIEYAKKKYDSKWYICRDLNDFSFTYTDAITMFETLEHLKKKQGKALLDKVNKFANYLVLSTPKDARLGKNKYHLSQWTIEEIKECLQGFDTVSVFGQDWSSGQVVFPFSKQISMFIIFAYNSIDEVGYGTEK